MPVKAQLLEVLESINPITDKKQYIVVYRLVENGKIIVTNNFIIQQEDIEKSGLPFDLFVERKLKEIAELYMKTKPKEVSV